MSYGTFKSSDKESWYFGPLSREETQNRLLKQTHGTFLIRDSKSCVGDYVLSVSENSKVSHYIINKLQSQLKIGDQMFDSMPELLDFYKIHYLDTTTLLAPLSKVSNSYSENKHMSYTPGGSSSDMQSSSNDFGDTSFPRQSKSSVLVKGIFEFKSDDPDDLPFQKGEILEIVEKPEENWWNARNNKGRVGQIPVPYVEVQAHKHYNEVGIGEKGNDRIQRRLSGTNIDASGPVYAQVITQRVPNAYDRTAIALEVGDVVKVTKMNRNGQWEGECNHKRGWFPFTHVRILEEK